MRTENSSEISPLSALGAKILREMGYKEPKPPVVEEMAFFRIDYSGGNYQACYQQTWDTDFDGELLDLVGMDLVYGETVMKVIGQLMTVLRRPIKADEWELGYDERDDQDD